MSNVFQQALRGKRRRTTDKCEVEAGCGKEGVSGKNVENDGKRIISAWDVGILNGDEEIRSPKRKAIQVESEETQDYVKEGRSTEKEEEERTFAPSAASVPLKPLFCCD